MSSTSVQRKDKKTVGLPFPSLIELEGAVEKGAMADVIDEDEVSLQHHLYLLPCLLCCVPKTERRGSGRAD